MARKVPPPPPLPAWDAAPAYTAPKSEFARDMEVSAGAVSQWCAKGLPVRDDGLIDIAVATKWLLDNLDALNGHRTRARAWDMHHFITAQKGERLLVKMTVEAAGAAAYEAAIAAGMAEEPASALADATTAGTVERMNPSLTDETNIALPPPPAGVWREHLTAEKVAEAEELAL